MSSRLSNCVLAVGGSVLARSGQKGTPLEQSLNAKTLAILLTRFVKNQPSFHRFKGERYASCLVHGNGPQVGNIQRQQEAVANVIPPYGLDFAVAMTQGSMGYLIERCLSNEFVRNKLEVPIATIITQVLVDPKDPALEHATKAVGRYYPKETAIQLQRDLNWAMQEEPAKGWRQVVPSPQPLKVSQSKMVAGLMEYGNFVIAAGGGGIPVAVGLDGTLEGIDAVIDKDFTAAKLADDIDAKLFVLCTNVDKVYLHYSRPHQSPIDFMTTEQAKNYLRDGHFLPGTMGTKIQAALEYLKGGKEREVLIATPEDIATGDPMKIGTRISNVAQ